MLTIKRLIFLSLAGTLFFSTFAAAATIDLTGTIRDFKADGVNFEGPITGFVPGMVETTLGIDGNPVYTGLGGVTNFDQWYNDVAGVNLSAPLTITLDNGQVDPGGVYSYQSSSFFPIDNQLFGNEGRDHNFHFTFELRSQFTYTGGESFSFTGDDDLWVFINDQLVIDLGGVHPQLSASVDLDTLGLTVGNIYAFDLFFAERHTTQSNFKIQTTIVLDPTPVPEPGTLLLFGAGIFGLGVYRRIRN